MLVTISVYDITYDVDSPSDSAGLPTTMVFDIDVAISRTMEEILDDIVEFVTDETGFAVKYIKVKSFTFEEA